MTRVLIVDDHLLFGDAIKPTLAAAGLEVIAVARTGAEGLEEARRHRPELVLVDLGLPDRDGMDVATQILLECADTKVVVVTALDDARFVAEALRRGLHGYLTKDTPLSRFLSGVRAAIDGQVVVPKGLAAAAVIGGRRRDMVSVLADQLTSREREVLGLLVEGMDGRAIANQLTISTNTVRTHIQSILTKLQVHSRLEAATFAVRNRLVDRPGERRRAITRTA